VSKRAERARNLLQDPVLTESLAALKDTYTAALRGCAAKDDLGRFRYAVALDVIDGRYPPSRSCTDLGEITPQGGGRCFQSANPIQAIARIF